MQIQQEVNVLHSFREFNVDDGEVCDYIYELMDGDGVCFLYIDLYQWYADMQLDSIRRRFNHECFDVDVWESLRFGFLIMDDYRQGWRHGYSILRAIMRGETRKIPGMGKVNRGFLSELAAAHMNPLLIQPEFPMNLFDSLNNARRLTELAGAVLERSKRYPQRFALKTTPPLSKVQGTGEEIEITVKTNGLRRRVKATRISGCTVYWEV